MTFNAYQADLYSLGVCLHVLLTGEYPQREGQDSQYINTEGSSDESEASMQCEGEIVPIWKGIVSEECD